MLSKNVRSRKGKDPQGPCVGGTKKEVDPKGILKKRNRRGKQFLAG